MKFNKSLVLILVAVVIVLLAIGGGAYYLLKGNSTSTSVIPGQNGQNVKKLSGSDIGLSVTVRPDNKGVVLKIAKLEGIESIEYSLSYDANVTEEGQTAVVPRGVEGSSITVKSSDSEISRNLDLGTCSRNVCKYDDVVSEITVTVRVNYKDGTVGGVEEKVSLNK